MAAICSKTVMACANQSFYFLEGLKSVRPWFSSKEEDLEKTDEP